MKTISYSWWSPFGPRWSDACRDLEDPSDGESVESFNHCPTPHKRTVEIAALGHA